MRVRVRLLRADHERVGRGRGRHPAYQRGAGQPAVGADVRAPARRHPGIRRRQPRGHLCGRRDAHRRSPARDDRGEGQPVQFLVLGEPGRRRPAVTLRR